VGRRLQIIKPVVHERPYERTALHCLVSYKVSIDSHRGLFKAQCGFYFIPNIRDFPNFASMQIALRKQAWSKSGISQTRNCSPCTVLFADRSHWE